MIIKIKTIFGQLAGDNYQLDGRAFLGPVKKSTRVIFYTPKIHECCFLFITCHHLLGNGDFNGHFIFKK
jgi:hypothetical protein